MPDRLWFQSNAADKEVFITFDDGPHPEITPWVLEHLEKRAMKASFFCIGDNAKKHPETFQIIKNSGMTIGNHSMHHLNGWKTDLQTYVDDVHLATTQLGPCNYFRPPYGKMGWRQSQVLKKDFKIVMWSMVTGDWKSNLNHQNTLHQLKKHSISGFIPVFHDSEKAWHNLKEILPSYLDFLQQNGLTSQAL